MNESFTAAANEASYELRFFSRCTKQPGYAFPCDAQGCVEMSALSDHDRSSYLYARVVAGNELAIPVVVLVA